MATNISSALKDSAPDFEENQLVSDEVTEVFLRVLNDVAAPVFSLFGIVANIMNILVYIKLGVKDPSNLSFLTLALSDLCGLCIGLVFEISCYPWLNSIPDLTFEPMSVGYLVAAWPRAYFSRVTCCITVFITVERCLCIAFPLKVKAILTSTRTLLILLALFAASFFVNFISIYTGALYLTFRFNPAQNRSILGMGISDTYDDINVVNGTLNTATFVFLFAVLITSASILTIELKRKTKWRRELGTVHQSKFQALSKRDKSVSVTIAILALVLTLTYLPFTAICIGDIVIDGFYTHRSYSNFYDIMFMISLTFECVNSSSSLLVYYKMSSQYRKTFKLVVKCIGHFQKV